MTDDAVELLQQTAFDMISFTPSYQDLSYTQTDAEGNQTTRTIKVGIITVTYKTPEEMAVKYGLAADETELLLDLAKSGTFGSGLALTGTGSFHPPCPSGVFALGDYPTKDGTTYHPGRDITAPAGSPVYAAADGTVTQTGYQIKYAYDAYGNLSELTYPDGTKVTYTYDALDRMTAITDRDGETTTYTYNANDQVTRVDRPNNTYSTIKYDEMGNVTEVQNLRKVFDDAPEKGNAVFAYTYDESGFITGELAIQGVTVIEREFTYDEKGQIASVHERTDINGEGTWEESTTKYQYDAAGNRIREEYYHGPVMMNYMDHTYNDADQLVVSVKTVDFLKLKTHYTYDANGNLTQEKENLKINPRNYTYDHENRLQAVKAGMYELTGYINNINAEHTQVLMEYGSNGRFSNVYDYGVWRNSVDVKSARKTYYMYDGRGSVSGLTGQEGYDVVTYRYDIYGEETQSAATYNPYRYNAEYTDMATGLQYLRSRYYSPAITRFLSKDPVLGVATLPYTFNPYLYCLNNALNYFDPTGMFFKEIFGTVAGAAKGVWNAGKAIFDSDVTVAEGWNSGWQSGKAAGNWRGDLWDSSIERNIYAQQELAMQTGQAALPYASSTGGVQMQDVYPETMRSETLDQIETHQNSLNEKKQQEQSYESRLNDLTKALNSTTNEAERTELKNKIAQVEERQRILCEEMHQDRLYIAAGVNEIVSTVAPLVPGAGSIIGIAVKFANAGIYGSLGEDEKALVAGVSGGLDTVNLVAASVVFGQMYKNALADADIAASNSAAIKGSASSGKGAGGIKSNLPQTSFTTSKLQHEFKHAGDFGIKGDWNKSVASQYQNAIQNHINTAPEIYKSVYRGSDVYVYLNRETGIGAYVGMDGSYVGGWKFNSRQIDFHTTNGILIERN